MLIDVIGRAKFKLIQNNISPPYSICLSPSAHELLIYEMNQRDGRRHTKIFEIDGMKVEIDPLCPQQGAYIIGGEPK